VATGGSGGASHRSQLPLISGQGGGASGRLQVTVPRDPHLPYMVLRDRGPQPQLVGSSDKGGESRAQLAHPLGQLVEIKY
jgi:hypothetical protein